jgi:hypothetical protein
MINIEVENIFEWDAPDYCDAFISYAEHDDGTPLSEDELEELDSAVVYEAIINNI